MRKFVPIIVILLLSDNHLFAQNQFEVLTERKGEKTFKGIISREALENDTSFKWYAQGQKTYTPNAVALAALKQYGDSIQIIAFMGTWCEDSHFIIPRFYSLLDAANFSKDKISLIGVDRSKKTLSHLTEALDIKNVPTLMVMKNGKELGRVVEYGKTGQWDKEFGEIINAAFTK
ncbi:MAG TPA: thioredoxin family protein [Chitinophagaceae bacterium]